MLYLPRAATRFVLGAEGGAGFTGQTDTAVYTGAAGRREGFTSTVTGREENGAVVGRTSTVGARRVNRGLGRDTVGDGAFRRERNTARARIGSGRAIQTHGRVLQAWETALLA